jgi:hypothetical protein
VRTALVALLVLAPLLAPTATAEIQLRGRAYVLPDLHHVHFWVNMTLSDVHATQTRQEADSDGDGRVSDGERIAYEASLRQSAEGMLDEPQVRRDGQDPTTQSVLMVRTRGLTQSTLSTAAIDIDLGFVANFSQIGEGPRFTVSRDTQTGDKGPIRVTVPPGYIPLAGKGIDDWRLDEDGRTILGTNSGRTDLELYFWPEDHPDAPRHGDDEDSPGGRGIIGQLPGPEGLLLLAALAPLLRRRTKA